MAILAPPADQPEADYRVTFLEPAADVPAFGGYPATPWWRSCAAAQGSDPALSSVGSRRSP